jgi:hypothetical protein
VLGRRRARQVTRGGERLRLLVNVDRGSGRRVQLVLQAAAEKVRDILHTREAPHNGQPYGRAQSRPTQGGIQGTKNVGQKNCQVRDHVRKKKPKRQIRSGRKKSIRSWTMQRPEEDWLSKKKSKHKVLSFLFSPRQAESVSGIRREIHVSGMEKEKEWGWRMKKTKSEAGQRFGLV